MKDCFAAGRDLVGSLSKACESELNNAQAEAMAELESAAGAGA